MHVSLPTPFQFQSEPQQGYLAYFFVYPSQFHSKPQKGSLACFFVHRIVVLCPLHHSSSQSHKRAPLPISLRHCSSSQSKNRALLSVFRPPHRSSSQSHERAPLPVSLPTPSQLHSQPKEGSLACFFVHRFPVLVEATRGQPCLFHCPPHCRSHQSNKRALLPALGPPHCNSSQSHKRSPLPVSLPTPSQFHSEPQEDSLA